MTTALIAIAAFIGGYYAGTKGWPTKVWNWLKAKKAEYDAEKA